MKENKTFSFLTPDVLDSSGNFEKKIALKIELILQYIDLAVKKGKKVKFLNAIFNLLDFDGYSLRKKIEKSEALEEKDNNNFLERFFLNEIKVVQSKKFQVWHISSLIYE